MTDLSNLPKYLRDRPDIRAHELRVYRKDERTYQVPGRRAIYDVIRFGGNLTCSCIAANNGAECAHALAVRHYIEQEMTKLC